MTALRMFSSRPPFDGDPEPYYDTLSPSGRRYATEPVPRIPWSAIIHHPRREYVRPQHNPTNPILGAYREQNGGAWPERDGMGLDAPETWLEAIRLYEARMHEPRPDSGWDGPDPFDIVNVWPAGNTVTTAHIEHARTVLTRAREFDWAGWPVAASRRSRHAA